MNPAVRTRATVRYAFDERNRLVVRGPRDGADEARPTRIFEGSVATDWNNLLVYHLSSDGGREQPGQTFNLDGTWRLTPDHDLALTLHGTEERQRQTVFLRGAIVKAEANALVFALRRWDGGGLDTAQRLTLSGRWRADARNRLTFLVEKMDGSEDRLTLGGGWEVGPHHELVYRYRRRATPGRGREEHRLAFEGAWDITRGDRLVYRLAGSQDSAFEFLASLQSPSLLAREGRIAYQVGIGVSGDRVQRRRVALFGTWKLNHDLSVSFEIPYAGGRIEAIRFEGTYAVGPRNRITAALRSSRRERLGLTVVFTRELVPDANLFLRLKQDADERSAIAGVHVRF